jgi:hypothetical protein
MLETSVGESGSEDEFGYPLDITRDARHHTPIELPAAATPADQERHAAAYAAYQERFATAFRERRQGQQTS